MTVNMKMGDYSYEGTKYAIWLFLDSLLTKYTNELINNEVHKLIDSPELERVFKSHLYRKQISDKLKIFSKEEWANNFLKCMGEVLHIKDVVWFSKDFGERMTKLKISLKDNKMERLT